MAEEDSRGNGTIPTLHVVAHSVPEAYWKTLKAVHEYGYILRTEYDRKDRNGKCIDPPGRDAKVLVEVEDLFAEPSFPRLSYVERGKYIAEFLGVKDHLVVPYHELLQRVKEGRTREEDFETTQTPYCYHQRLTTYPLADGTTLNQLEIIAKRVAQSPITRRAVAITGVPEIDLFLKSDQPCLREIQLRAIEDAQGRLVLNPHATWRSRDLYKAWGDNVVGMRNLLKREVLPILIEERRKVAAEKGKKPEEIILLPYSEANGSLHNYGQDYTDKGMDTFFQVNPTVESFLAKCMTSEEAMEKLIIPELEEFRKERYQWRFPPKAVEIIDSLIEDMKAGRYIP